MTDAHNRVASHLRLDLALVHAAPGACTRLHLESGRTLEVGTHATADIHPCAMRRTVVSARCAAELVAAAGITALTVGGHLTARHGDIYERPADGSWWFATQLRPDRVCQLIEEIDADDTVADQVEVQLKPDSSLGVTVVRVGPMEGEAACAAIVRTAAQACYSVCVVDEVIAQATQASVIDHDRGN